MVASGESPAGVLNSITRATASKGLTPISQGRSRPCRVSRRPTTFPAIRSVIPAHTLVTP